MYTNESLLTMRLRKTQGMPCLHRMMNYRMTDLTLGTAFKSVLILLIISHFYLSNFCTTFQNLWQMLQSKLKMKQSQSLKVTFMDASFIDTLFNIFCPSSFTCWG